MRRFVQCTALGAAAWIVAGCAPTVLLKSADGITFDNPTDSVVTIDVLARYQRRQALDLADAHCRRFGRAARQRSGHAASYPDHKAYREFVILGNRAKREYPERREVFAPGMRRDSRHSWDMEDKLV